MNKQTTDHQNTNSQNTGHQNTAHQNIGVIGATGKTGARVLTSLQQLGFSTRALSRQSMPSFDWNQSETWADALAGLDAVYVTYHPDLAIPRAESDIRQLVIVAKQVGVKHVVLLSGRGEEGAQKAEAVVKNSGLAWNVVRASWFMQNFSESFMLDGILSRHLVLPEPKANEPFIDVDDIADVVVATLTRQELRNQLFEVTGPEILSFDNCIQTIGDAIGESVTFQTIPVDAFISAAVDEGMPEDIAWLMQELFTQVLDGRNAHTTNTIKQVLGRPPRRFADYVQSVVLTGVWDTATAREVEPC